MMNFTQLISRLNKNKFFKFSSSVRLAVPLMLILASVVAWGTILESQYNSEYSSLMIYKSEWFGLLLILLWMNIFLATISRWPFKKHHTGFVITHIGLLTLLIGGYVTNQYGIDGQLSVGENQSSRSVVLSKLMLGYIKEGQNSIQKVVFSKKLSPLDKSKLDFLNSEMGHLISVEKYLPFAKLNKGYKPIPLAEGETKTVEIALSFILKSQFFNVSEWLHTKDNPVMQLGPATLKIINTDAHKPALTKKSGSSKHAKTANAKAPPKSSNPKDDKVLLLDKKTGTLLAEFRLSQITNKSVEFQGLKIQLKKKYKAAIVSGNKLAENPDPNSSNPALEVDITKGNEKLREVLYAQFKDFSLNKNGVFGYRLTYEAAQISPSSEENTTSEDTMENAVTTPSGKPMGARIIEFHVSKQNPNQAEVVLIKEGQEVLRQVLREGEKLTTPWMGIEIFLGSVQLNSVAVNEVINISPEKRSELPPSALLLKSDSEQTWLTEGEEKIFHINNQSYNFYFGKEIIELPFEINLKNFKKLDYPGTNTPMSYESLVQVDQDSAQHKISMNEPLKREGYTIYQASYILNPGQPPVSIFSVNKDPGRPLKYIGSLILSLGIIIFTLMRSRYWKKLTEKGN